MLIPIEPVEVAFQANKRRKRLIEAAAEGHVLEKELDDRFEADREEYCRRKRDADASHNLRAAERAAVLSGGPPDLWQPGGFLGRFNQVFQTVQPMVSPAELARRQLLARPREEANLFIVDDVTNPGQRVSWTAAVRGCAVITANVLSTGGHALVFKGAVNRGSRRVWRSPAWMLTFPMLGLILERAVAGSKWRLVDCDMDAYLRLPTKTTIALVTSGDKQHHQATGQNVVVAVACGVCGHAYPLM